MNSQPTADCYTAGPVALQSLKTPLPLLNYFVSDRRLLIAPNSQIPLSNLIKVVDPDSLTIAQVPDVGIYRKKNCSGIFRDIIYICLLQLQQDVQEAKINCVMISLVNKFKGFCQNLKVVFCVFIAILMKINKFETRLQLNCKFENDDIELRRQR